MRLAQASAAFTTIATVVATVAAMVAVPIAASDNLGRARLDVPSLHLRVPLEAVPCQAYWGPSLPSTERAFFADCSSHGFYGIVARRDGPLGPLTDAPRATLVQWRNDDGHTLHRKLSMTIGGAQADPDGTWPGHGVPAGMPVFVALRSEGEEIEREGDRYIAPSQIMIDVADQGVDIMLYGEHAPALDRRVINAHFVAPQKFSFTLFDMALVTGTRSARFQHGSGLVSLVEVDGSGRNVSVRVSLRWPTSHFQVGVAGGFEIGIDFS